MAGPKDGDVAPGFELPDADGRARTLAEFRGAPLVLYFYPSDFTPGCTKEACSFRDAEAALSASGVQVVGVSPDPPRRHAKFRDKHGLNYPLLSDEDSAVAQAYGAKGIFRTKRVTFVIDGEGRIVRRIASPLPGPHIRAALAHAQEVRS